MPCESLPGVRHAVRGRLRAGPFRFYDRPVETLCRDCGQRPPPDAGTCPACRSARVLRHRELHDLAIAHLDCDAFYAAIEKRDRPELRDVPVIVGGRHRGVVAACCYIARTYAVHSAMPMLKALKACPDAAVVKPDMKKYAAVGREVRAIMLKPTPLVEPLSIDEAFMDLSGTESLHRTSPSTTLAGPARRVSRGRAPSTRIPPNDSRPGGRVASLHFLPAPTLRGIGHRHCLLLARAAVYRPGATPILARSTPTGVRTGWSGAMAAGSRCRSTSRRRACASGDTESGCPCTTRSEGAACQGTDPDAGNKRIPANHSQTPTVRHLGSRTNACDHARDRAGPRRRRGSRRHRSP